MAEKRGRDVNGEAMVVFWMRNKMGLAQGQQGKEEKHTTAGKIVKWEGSITKLW